MSDLQATSFLAPLFATVLAIVYLRERVPLQRWVALGVGMIGAFIILRPLAPTFGVGQVLALVAAMAIGIGAPLIKQLTATDDADKIVFITNALLIPASLVPALFVWHWPPAHVWPYLAAMGLCACLGHVAMTRAYQFRRCLAGRDVRFRAAAVRGADRALFLRRADRHLDLGRLDHHLRRSVLHHPQREGRKEEACCQGLRLSGRQCIPARR